MRGASEVDRKASYGRLFKAEAEVCMRLALLVVPARDVRGDLIGLPEALSLIQDAAVAEASSATHDWQAAQMIGLVSEAIATALGWQQQPARLTSSVIDSIRHRVVYDNSGNLLETPTEIVPRQPIATDARELCAKTLARKDLIVRFGNLGEALGTDDDACLPQGAGVVFQCWLPCIEAFVTEDGSVRLRSQEHGAEEYMIRELYAKEDAKPVDLIRLESSAELEAVLRMLGSNLHAAGLADARSALCLDELNALFSLTLGQPCTVNTPVPADRRMDVGSTRPLT